MTRPPIELSAAEWEIMHTVWQTESPVTVRRILDAAYPNREKAYTTVQTFMNILVDKGVLTSERIGRQLHYTPTIQRQDALHGSLQGAARRMFHGSFGAMASFLVGSAQLTQDDIAQLRRILDDREDEQ
ncbi:BlaI/MecI/CopY family transcriptional regulator [Candidatus Neomarinimicrobiota bacterium]